jgi:hypothetical protein
VTFGKLCNSFHEALEAGRCPEKALWNGDPLVLPLAWHGEGGVKGSEDHALSFPMSLTFSGVLHESWSSQVLA